MCLAREQELSTTVMKEPANDVEQRGFTTPAWADHGYEFARANIEGYVVEG